MARYSMRKVGATQFSLVSRNEPCSTAARSSSARLKRGCLSRRVAVHTGDGLHLDELRRLSELLVILHGPSASTGAIGAGVNFLKGGSLTLTFNSSIPGPARTRQFVS